MQIKLVSGVSDFRIYYGIIISGEDINPLICDIAQIVDISIVDNQVFRTAAAFGKLGRQSREEPLPLDRSTVTGLSFRLRPPITRYVLRLGDLCPRHFSF